MVMYEPDDTVTYPQMFYIEDLGSANGTYVNNHLVGSANQPGVPYLLNDGDRIEIGDCWRFEFEQKAREGPLAEFPHEFQREHAVR